MKATTEQVQYLQTDNSRFRGCKRKRKNQVTVQAAAAVMMTFRDTDTGPQLSTMPNQCDNQRQRNVELVLEKLRFNCECTG